MTAPASMVIDCDVHPTIPSMKTLLPYFDDHWREAMVRRGIDDQTTISFPTVNPLSYRADWKDATGRAATSVEQMAAQALGPFGTSLAICNCLFGAQAAYSEDISVVLARAVNDWMAREWLDRDSRLRASIVVPQQSPDRCVEEIERVAEDKRFVQVLLLVSGEIPLGRRAMWPIYAAAERLGLPIGIHAGNMYRNPTTAVGWADSYTEEYVNHSISFQSQLNSLVTEGVFAKFPGLKVVLSESGVSWLPHHAWRLTKFWKGLRSEIPWVSDPPGSIIRDHVRLTLQPFDGPDDDASVVRLMEHFGSDEMILFSTDYPHWQFDGLNAMPKGINASLAKKIMADNPLATYPRLQQQTAQLESAS